MKTHRKDRSGSKRGDARREMEKTKRKKPAPVRKLRTLS